jgi:hypothetical protein
MLTTDGLVVPDMEQRVHMAIMNTLESGHDLFDVFLSLDALDSAYFIVYVLPVLERVQ